MNRYQNTEASAIWHSIVGNKGFLPSARVENLSAILERELGLQPVMAQYGEGLVVWTTRESFTGRRVAMHPDGWCRLFYHPRECEKATGSRDKNFLAWTNNLLKYGRKSHAMAPYMQPPHDVMRELVRRGCVESNISRARLLSLEAVCFYLAAQSSTWTNMGKIIRVKDLLKSQGLEVVPPEPEDTGEDILKLIPMRTTAAPERTLVKTSLPKKAQVLLEYNPHRKPEVPHRKPEADISTLSVEALKDQIQKLQEIVAEKEAKALRQSHLEQAKKGVIVEGDVWADRGQWTSFRMAFPDGSTATYYHESFLKGESRRSVVRSERDLMDTTL